LSHEGCGSFGDQARRAIQGVQVLHDLLGIVHYPAIIENETGDLAQRIHLLDAGLRHPGAIDDLLVGDTFFL